MPLDSAKLVRAGWLSLVVVTVLAATGCSGTQGLVGKWESDRTALVGTPSEENVTAEFFSPVPKFAIQFAKAGDCTVSWQEGGETKTKTGTWQTTQDDGLKLTIIVKFPPAEEMEIDVGLEKMDQIKLQGKDIIAAKHGPFRMKRTGS